MSGGLTIKENKRVRGTLESFLGLYSTEDIATLFNLLLMAKAVSLASWPFLASMLFLFFRDAYEDGICIYVC